jgi:nucleoside-diphosphate-sugar epimerase
MAVAARPVGIFNLAGGKSVSIKDLAIAALNLFGRDHRSSISFSGTDAQENYRGSFPIDAAFRSFGYYPETDIADGLKSTAKAWGLL